MPRRPKLRQRVLVVEDDQMIRRLNTEVLTCSGYEVDSAVDGADAWCALQLDNYDLIVTDHDMPKLSGVGLLQKLHAARQSLPVIMAAGTFPQPELDRHPWLQIHATLLKPYTFAVLIRTVKTVLRAATDASGEVALPPNWQSPLPANTSRS
ncbi:MAG TPA: response regulator [Candidatus Sulfotelmatobacter sp.]|nr:response regulator [Candidatus Sulfotelmatobacter sp.]